MASIGQSGHASHLELDTWAQVIGAWLMRHCGLFRPRPDGPAHKVPAAARARVKQPVETGLQETLSVETLAMSAGIDPCQFSRAFERAAGTTPHQYAMQRRVDRARAMLPGRDAAERRPVKGNAGTPPRPRFIARARALYPWASRTAAERHATSPT
ncbi:MAG: AraC family transcriptional regulator [Pseudomonadota bacterium]